MSDSLFKAKFLAKFTPESTPQEIFDEIRKANELGMFPCLNHGSCSNRSEDGKACVFGIFIPDDKINKRNVGDGAKSMFLDYLDKKDYPPFFFDEGHMSWWFITRLQNIHDSNSESFDLKRVKKLFHDYGWEVS